MKIDKSLMALFQSNQPGRVLRELHENGWLEKNLPEVNALYGVPQKADHHPEVDTGRHIELCLDQAAMFGAQARVRWAVMLHDLGKGITPKDQWPAHINHERTGLALVHAVNERFNAPPTFLELSLAVCENHLHLHRAFVMRSSSVNKLIRKLNFEASPEFLADFVLACRCDATGRLGKSHARYRQGAFIIGCATELRKYPMKTDTPEANKESAERYNQRLNAIRLMRKIHDTNIGKEKTTSYI